MELVVCRWLGLDGWINVATGGISITGRVLLKAKVRRVNMGKANVMEANGGETATEEAKVDSCGICSKHVMKNTIRKKVYTRCGRMKKVTSRMVERFVQEV